MAGKGGPTPPVWFMSTLIRMLLPLADLLAGIENDEPSARRNLFVYLEDDLGVHVPHSDKILGLILAEQVIRIDFTRCEVEEVRLTWAAAWLGGISHITLSIKDGRISVEERTQ